MKIAIIGHSGSGKSTLARELGGKYMVPVLFLDTVQFIPSWVERNSDEGRLIVNQFMKNEGWVIDGNYEKFFQRERLEEADKIIFMNFPRRICLYRAFKRYFKYRHATREDMANGCIEKMDLEFIWWILHKGRSKKRSNHYKQIEKEFKNKIVILKNPKEVEVYLQS